MMCEQSLELLELDPAVCCTTPEPLQVGLVSELLEEELKMKPNPLQVGQVT